MAKKAQQVNSLTDDVGIISDEDQKVIDLWLVAVTTTIVSFFAVLTNIVNIGVFAQQGLKECMNFNLFCLSICDFNKAVFSLIYGLTHAAELLTGLRLPGLGILLRWFRAVFLDLGTGYIMFIAIERCLCVTSPFKFRYFFNIRKTRTIMALITIFVVVNYIVLLGTYRVEWQFNENTNVTMLIRTVTVLHDTVVRVNDMLLATTLTLVCQVSMFVCAVLMFIGLRKSSVVRSVRTALPVGETSNKGYRQSMLSAKEKQLVKMVFLVAIVYLLTCVPAVLVAAPRAIEPRLAVDYGNLFHSLISIFLIFGEINGCANFFIYYIHSSSYRITVLGITRCCRQDKGDDKKLEIN